MRIDGRADYKFANNKIDPHVERKHSLIRNTMSAELVNRLSRASVIIRAFGDGQRKATNHMLQRSADVIGRYKLQRKCTRDQFICSSRGTLNVWNVHRENLRIRNQRDGCLFNPLLFFPFGETKHSELLGYLLKPNAQHGQGASFLFSFLRMLDVPEPEKGQWSVTVESERVDIMLKRIDPFSVIIIENKSHGAIDQRNQLYRYWHAQVHQINSFLDYSCERTRRSFQIIYLPGNAGKTPEPHSLRRPDNFDSSLPEVLPITPKLLNYRESIANWISVVSKSIPEENYRLRAYLEFYQEICLNL